MNNTLNVHAIGFHEHDMTKENTPYSTHKDRYPLPVMSLEDNLEFLAKVPDNSIQLIITSPPYNIGKSYEKQKPLASYIASQKRVISECVRVLHPKGSLCWQVGNFVSNGSIIPLDIVLYEIFAEFGLSLRNRIVWHFEHGLHCKNRFSGRYETINWFTKSDDYIFNLDPVRVPAKYPNKRHFKGPKKGKISGNPLGKNPGDLWVFPNVKANHVEKTIHPCQFPIELVERLVLSLSNEGDTVLDPYLGVGSTVLGSVMHHRHALGCDVVKEYLDIAWLRYQELTEGNLKTRPMTKPVYDPALPKGGQG